MNLLNKNLISKHWKEILKIVGILLIFYLSLKYLLPFLTSEEFRQLASENYVLGSVLIIVYIVVSHIFAPLMGSPILFVGFAVYGLFLTSILGFIAGTISSIICFYISRAYGRELVKKFAGEGTLKKVDEFVEVSGIPLLFFSRIFASGLHEVVSYAFGLTKINFKDYILYSTISSFLSVTIFILFFRKADFTSPKAFYLYYGMLAVLLLIFYFVFYRRALKKAGKQKTVEDIFDEL